MHHNVTHTDAEAALAEDWALFESIERGASHLAWRCWELATPVVVLGRHGSETDVRIDACAAAGVPVLRRFSGGGTVVLGPGCLNYAVAISFVSCPDLVAVPRAFSTLLGALVDALGVAGLVIAGTTDLAIGDRKVSGNAQRRGSRGVLHHGTLLYDFDPSLAARYLTHPARQPAYRRRRAHDEFLGTLPLDADTLRARLATAWQVLVPSPALVDCPECKTVAF
jgi:lipoate---protein ligase